MRPSRVVNKERQPNHPDEHLERPASPQRRHRFRRSVCARGHAVEGVTQESPTIGPLNGLGAGQRGRIVEIRGGRRLARRCLALGLRVGGEVIVAQTRGGGLVVASGGNRIALGRDIADRVFVERAAR